MSTLADLDRAVQTTLASKRLGQPVFVRCTLQSLDKPADILRRLAESATVVQRWVGQPLDRIYAVGNLESGQVTLTLQLKDGATGLVTFARGQPRGDGIDLMVLGNRGALYHDAGAAELWDEPPAAGALEGDRAIQAAIERALRSGKPEPVGKGTNP